MNLQEVQKFNFENLFTFEMANNHQGSVDHGKKIIQEMAAIAKEFNLKAAVKLQFRNLDTFIHPDYRDKKDVKHIPRFLSTSLSAEQFGELIEEVSKHGLITMATPFDEDSVGLAESLGIEVIKVASCSADDWPLLEKIADTGKPVIISVGGLTIKEIDKVVSFFEHRGTNFALMHCVAIYPTPGREMHLNQIQIMKERYPNLTIGFSTHEDPSDTSIIGLAYAKGARIYEKHVGVSTDTITLNKYSANPEQARAWVLAYKNAQAVCGAVVERAIGEQEKNDLWSLKRGVFARREIKAGSPIYREDVFFAMPLVSMDQLKSGSFRNGFIADKDYRDKEAINKSIEPSRMGKREIIYTSVREAKGMLNIARISLSHDFSVELSHHHGLEDFDNTGCIIIDCINREYAKKIVVQLPGQNHPTHYHKIKDESFHVLYGTMEMIIEGKKRIMYPGDTVWVPRGVWHGFRTDEGVIFEEISTTSLEASGDSYYIDKKIARMSREERKTKLLNWGRHQFDKEI